MATAFEDRFGFGPEVAARAPGRVNLLGEHTDYNDGFVLPTAIPHETEVTMAVSRDGASHFFSRQLGTVVDSPANVPPPKGFATYIHGCFMVLQDHGFPAVPPMTVHVDSSVPIGSGLSSSAALEVATLRGLRERFALTLDDVTLARIAQEAEVRYAGVRCGIMDQMASSLCVPGRMLWLDTRTLERELRPLPPGSDLVILDSGVPRSLASSGYNQRRAECEAAARALNVKALRDVSDVALTRQLPAPLDRRARHVVTENGRVMAALDVRDANAFGLLMNASHASLREDFEVSTPELDTLVGLLQAHDGVFGARLTGAGFGGACVALVETGLGPSIANDVLRDYARRGHAGRNLL